MNPVTPRPPICRRTKLILVTLLVVQVLGCGGYWGQVWLARKLAARELQNVARQSWSRPGELSERFVSFHLLEVLAKGWKPTPWYGRWVDGFWSPRRTHYEFFRLATGEDLGDDPDAYVRWLAVHPSLVWDNRLKRLMDAPPAKEITP